MAQGRRSLGKWLLFAALALLLGTSAFCCGGVLMLDRLPGFLFGLVTEEQPLAVAEVPPDDGAEQRLVERFEAGGPVEITGAELVQLVDSAHDPSLVAFWVGIEDGTATIDASFRPPDDTLPEGYVNLHAVGTMKVEQGWFTHVGVDELTLSTWDLGQYVRGQELAPNANQSLANERAKDPNVALAFDQIERLETEGDHIVIELTPDGWQNIRSARKQSRTDRRKGAAGSDDD